MKCIFLFGFILGAVGLQVLVPIQTQAQGCSDAGFCTIGSLRAYGTTNEPGQRISLLLPVGVGDEEVVVFTPGLQYDNQFTPNWALQAKVTGNVASGNLGTASGLGDVIVSATYTFPTEGTWQTSVTLGSKVLLNFSNLKENGLSLPLQYQSSLGTVDLISGVSLTNGVWQFSAGWQQPLTGTNGNQFLPIYWASLEADKYAPGNDFNRKGDLLLRVARQFNSDKRVSVNAGLLGIYHLGEDTYIDANISSKPIAIAGSAGLTLNVTATAFWKVSEKWSIGLQGGIPLVVREVRPDGLTRSFVLAPEIRFNF